MEGDMISEVIEAEKDWVTSPDLTNGKCFLSYILSPQEWVTSPYLPQGKCFLRHMPVSSGMGYTPLSNLGEVLLEAKGMGYQP